MFHNKIKTFIYFNTIFIQSDAPEIFRDVPLPPSYFLCTINLCTTKGINKKTANTKPVSNGSCSFMLNPLRNIFESFVDVYILTTAIKGIINPPTT